MPALLGVHNRTVTFLRDVTHAYIGAVCVRGADFDRLPLPLRRAHYEEGAQYLLKAAKQDYKEIKANRAGAFVKARDVCKRLRSVESPEYELVWEGFARTDSNANHETIVTILRRLDVQEPWKSLDAAIPPNIHSLPAGTMRANQLIADLRDLRDARNRCAHLSADVASPPPWSCLLDYTTALQAVANGLVRALEARLGNMPS